jgi:hypothetical protein
MWTARVQGPGQARDVEPAQQSGEPVTAEAIRRVLARARANEWPIPELAYIDVGDGGSEAIPGLTALETYAAEAVEGYLGGGTLGSIGPAVRWAPRGHAPTLAWHDRTVCAMALAPGDDEVMLEYAEEPEDRDNETSLVGGRRLFTQRYVDWRLYAGRNSLVSVGETYLRRLEPGRWVARMRPPRGLPGILVGKVVRRLGPLHSIFDSDDSQPSRLLDHERSQPEIVAKYPELGKASLEGEAGIIFIHGARACCVGSLADLDGSVGLPVRRFEHDTFRPLGENAGELSGLIRSSVRLERLLLFGHSRGGLVARLAAAELRNSGWEGQVEVWTFGTPHDGTPLMGRGLELLAQKLAPLRRIHKLSQVGLRGMIDVATDEHGVPREDAVGAALSILMRGAALPDGLAIMAVDSAERKMMEKIPGLDTTHAFGGSCTADDVRGFAIHHAGFAHEMFTCEPNDLVVGLASSTAQSGGQALPEPCSHSGYFRDPTVRALMP